MTWRPNPGMFRVASSAVLLVAVACDRIAGLNGNRQQAPTQMSIPSGGNGPPSAATGGLPPANIGGALSSPDTAAAHPSMGGATQVANFSGGTANSDCNGGSPSAIQVSGGMPPSGGSETTGGAVSSSNTEAQDASSGSDSSADSWIDAESLPPLPTSCATSTLASCNGYDPCTSLWVPGGRFLMGRSDSGSDAFPTGGASEQPEHPVTISPFWLDKFEVTVGRFRQFVNSYLGNKPEPNAGAHPDILNSGWQSDWNDYLPGDATSLGSSMFLKDDKCNANFRTYTRAAGNNECLPVNCIDWYTAFAFCIWDGGRLPTEAEWEFAAAGGTENRLFPWGSDPPDNARAVFNCSASALGNCIPTDIRPIGSVSPEGDGRFGQADMAGSMMERTRDVFDPSFYTSGNATGNNVANLTDDAKATDSTTRDGNYLSSGDGLRAAARDNVYRTNRYDGVGFRCARGP